jgi:transcriptional regulator with XRE-family HTH domain
MIEDGVGQAGRLGATERTMDQQASRVSSEADINRAVGRALRDARRARGFTLKQLSARSGSSFKPSAVGGYERGERAISVERFCRLAAAYGVPAGELLARALRTLGGDVIVDLTRVEGPIGPPVGSSATLQGVVRTDPQTSGPSSRSSG